MAADLHLNNIAVVVDFLEGEPETVVLDYFGGPKAKGVKVKDGDPHGIIGRNLPREVLEPGSLLSSFVKHGLILRYLRLHIIDFGQGKFTIYYHSTVHILLILVHIAYLVDSDTLQTYSVHTPESLRAPELRILNGPAQENQHAVDVWAAACMVSPFAVAEYLCLTLILTSSTVSDLPFRYQFNAFPRIRLKTMRPLSEAFVQTIGQKQILIMMKVCTFVITSASVSKRDINVKNDRST